MKHLITAAMVFLLGAIGQLQVERPASNSLPPGEGKELVAWACTGCHGLKPIVMYRDGPSGWKYTVEAMVRCGAPLFSRETETVIQYLAENFGPESGPAAAGTLPEGPGKALVESRCTFCHDLERVTEPKRTGEDWKIIVRNMIERGITATPEEVQTITSYLAAHFGKDSK